MTGLIFRKTVVFSILTHLVAFGILGFSFGNKVARLNYPAVSFWGTYLRGSQFLLKSASSQQGVSLQRLIFARRPDTSLLDKAKNSPVSIPEYFLKPAFTEPYFAQKQIFIDQPLKPLLHLKPREPIIFHPALPYNFRLYFNDRQTAHVELAYNISASTLRNSVEIRRKITSGNLEVDLLSMRYISHYLFIQQASLTPGHWQAIKIDLSAREND